MSYIDQLRDSARDTGNIVCMGLDPSLATLPQSEATVRERLNNYFSELFHRMRMEGVTPAAFKPNIGYWASLDQPREEDFSGSLALADIFEQLETFFPGIPVILDSKRGDIARSSGNYAEEAFSGWGADAVTVSPYMGHDSVLPFAYEDKGVYVLVRTSNPGAVDFQDEVVLDRVDEKENYPLYASIAHRLMIWADQHPGLGAVVGATSPGELEIIAGIFSKKEIPMLIPGVGSQGGSAKEVMSRLEKAGYDKALARINSSSGLTHPWKKGAAPDDWLDQCMSAIRKLTEEAAV